MARNSLVEKKESISSFVRRADVNAMIVEVIGGKNKDRFVTSIVSAVSTNPALQECDRGSIISAALLGQALNLSPSPQLGQYYLVPFTDTKNNRKVAQFQLGYKGYLQLAIRSGQYRSLDVLSVKEGELISYDPFKQQAEFQVIDDPTEREQAKTVGYYAYFELLNGFRKELYWTREQMEAHATKYSQGYASDKRTGRSYTFWSKNFDGMAQKTMLRQLISKWGVMSIDMQTALETDMQVVHEDGTASFDDGIEAEFQEVEEVTPPKAEKKATEEVRQAPDEGLPFDVPFEDQFFG